MKVQDKPDYLIFASDAQTGELEPFPNIARGWGITIEQTESKPPMEWMNDAFNRVDKNTLYLLQQGVPEWDSAVVYPVDAIIKYQSELYIAITENNNSIPSSHLEKWEKVIPDIKEASTAQKGIVQLSSAIDSDSEQAAATSKAVKVAYDLANQALAKNVAIVGEFKLFPFRSSELPSGWYFRNGDRFPVTSDVGKALKSLSDNFKSDWGIVESDGYINLPTAFAPDGRGLFERPVNGIDRKVGSYQDDAIRNITASCGMDGIAFSNEGMLWDPQGAFCFGNSRNNVAQYTPTKSGITNDFRFDASRIVPTANENRPLNMGLTPAIYLGV